VATALGEIWMLPMGVISSVMRSLWIIN